MPRYRIATQGLGGAWGTSDFDAPIVGKYRAIAMAIDQNKSSGDPKRVEEIGTDKIVYQVGVNNPNWIIRHKNFLKKLKDDPNFIQCA